MLPKGDPNCDHVQDNQGSCHNCGTLLDRDLWELYAGKGAPHWTDKPKEGKKMKSTARVKPMHKSPSGEKFKDSDGQTYTLVEPGGNVFEHDASGTRYYRYGLEARVGKLRRVT